MDWLKFKFINIKTLKVFKFETESLSFDKCRFSDGLLDELVTDFPHIKKLHFESCDIKNLNLQKFENFEELGLIYTMEHGEKLSDILEIIGQRN